MLKSFCGFLFFGALIVGCACDFQCFMDKQYKNAQIIPTDPTSVDPCKDLKKQFDDMRSAIKDCSVSKIKVDKYEAFMKEVCTENSTSYKTFVENKSCFVSNSLTTLMKCVGDSNIELKEEDKDKPREVLKKFCPKLDGMYKCANKQFESLCGAEAGKLTQEATSAVASYTTGLCEEANAATVNQVLYMNILLGLLFVLMMSHKN